MTIDFPRLALADMNSVMPTDLDSHEPSRRNWLSFIAIAAMTGLNAFNDNFARFMLLPLGGWLVSQGAGFPIEHPLAILMVMPYLLFAPSAGWLADRFPKNLVARWAAWMQVVGLAFMAYSVWERSLLLAVCAFFVLALQSALLSPAKVGILKELLGRKKLAFGSGVSEGITILSVLLGQILAGIIFDQRLAKLGDGWAAAAGPVFFLAAACLLAVVLARLIEPTPAHEVGPLTPRVAFRHVRDFRTVWAEKPLRLCSLGVAFFWGFATFILLAVYEVAYQLHDGGEGTGTTNSFLMATASVGIVVGSVTAGLLSRRGTELGLVPLGGVVMTSGAILLALAPEGGWLFRGGLFVAGAGAAVFLVPLKAHLIDLSPSEERGKVLSVSNLMNNLGGAAAIALQLLFKIGGVAVAWQMAFFAVFAAAVTLYVAKLLPRSFWRLIALTLIRRLYRIEALQAGNMPASGGVILCPNHLSFVDSLVVSAASPRPVRFLIAEKCYRHRWVGHFARLFEAVPVSPEKAKEAIRLAAEEAAAGNVVCLFPEGQLSRTGAICEVKRGFEMIARKADCPVVVAHMHGLWGTFTSFAGGRYFRKWPRRWGSRLQVRFSEPLPPRAATAGAVAERWRVLAEASLEEESLACDLRPGEPPLLCEPPAGWREEWRQVCALGREERQLLVRQARELAAVAFWERGDRVLLEWSPGEELSRVLAFFLPTLTGVRIAPVAAGTREKELQHLAREEALNRVVLQRDSLSPTALAQLAKGGRRVQLLAAWRGGEDVLREEGLLPSLVQEGRIVTWSMPHPEEKNSSLALFQPGWKEGSVGRLLPSRTAPAGWREDSERFLFRQAD
ncbi:MFS transporter [Roseibacillus ishigakijimensis]|uniref:MFS transporter n=1 Tax=Roseibacillus ishigakijimensis TaxID=454146 RepID=A0A934RPY7_9BACT|nr:MFS transporter [Roseibacillus ishigakijimensis]MBK1832959.1 MFS transporter [Roseibacillus ishigakijimensis]